MPSFVIGINWFYFIGCFIAISSSFVKPCYASSGSQVLVVACCVFATACRSSLCSSQHSILAIEVRVGDDEVVVRPDG